MSGHPKLRPVKRGMLDDNFVLRELCPHMQEIHPLQVHLAPRVRGRIFRPQKVSYMFNNLNLQDKDKEHLMRQFVSKAENQYLNIPNRQRQNAFTNDNIAMPVITSTNGPNEADMLLNDLLISIDSLQNSNSTSSTATIVPPPTNSRNASDNEPEYDSDYPSDEDVREHRRALTHDNRRLMGLGYPPLAIADPETHPNFRSPNTALSTGTIQSGEPNRVRTLLDSDRHSVPRMLRTADEALPRHHFNLSPAEIYRNTRSQVNRFMSLP